MLFVVDDALTGPRNPRKKKKEIEQTAVTFPKK
jgi:hypothetical protein